MNADILNQTYQQLSILLAKYDNLIATMPRKSRARQSAVQYAAGIKRALKTMATILKKERGDYA